VRDDRFEQVEHRHVLSGVPGTTTVEPGCLYHRDFEQYSDGRAPDVYAHVARQPDQPSILALQYRFYWYFNEFNDLHESDWEGIQLLFEASTAEEALASEPCRSGAV
jgi:hypothetical protein